MNKYGFEVGKEYKIRNGRPARIYSLDGGFEGDRIHGAIYDPISKIWHMFNWNNAGKVMGGFAERFDLMPPKKEFWVNIYQHGTKCIHASKATLGHDQDYGRVACVLVEYYEGQFDDQ